jgi:D-glycero-D-manno-heptose 1,7-bisphosphate phosphatase
MQFVVDKSWTLFLDRDGVINEKKNDYVKNISEFSFINDAIEALSMLSSLFGNIIVVTNQRGVGKGLMSENDLNIIHTRMQDLVLMGGGRIDKIYYCTGVPETSFCRKPNIGMALKAKNDFPEIDFEKSIIIGDSKSDMEFGKRLNMKTVFVGCGETPFNGLIDIKCSCLMDVLGFLKN